MEQDIFVHYNSSEEVQVALRKMLQAKEEWRAQIRELEQKSGLAI